MGQQVSKMMEAAREALAMIAKGRPADAAVTLESGLMEAELLAATDAENERAALSRARSEALEEAAKEADAHGVHVTAHNIRRLKGTPAPASIPVERVREVLRQARGMQVEGEALVEAIAEDLGVPLDATGGECPCAGLEPGEVCGSCGRRQ